MSKLFGEDSDFYKEEFIPETERQKFLEVEKELFQSIGSISNGIAKRLLLESINRSKSILNCRSEASRVTALRGYMYELERYNQFLKSSGGLITTYANIEVGDFEYESIPVNVQDIFFSGDKNVIEGKIELDVPIKVFGVPFIYELKSWPRKVYGTSRAHLNQLLKYQEAFSQGKVSGVVLEIRGNISQDFIEWAYGSIEYGSPIPNVEIYYCTELPSGLNFPIRIKEDYGGFSLWNDVISSNLNELTKEDQLFVNRIEKLVSTPITNGGFEGAESFSFNSYLSDFTGGIQIQSEALKTYSLELGIEKGQLLQLITKPEKIERLVDLNCYEKIKKHEQEKYLKRFDSYIKSQNSSPETRDYCEMEKRLLELFNYHVDRINKDEGYAKRNRKIDIRGIERAEEIFRKVIKKKIEIVCNKDTIDLKSEALKGLNKIQLDVEVIAMDAIKNVKILSALEERQNTFKNTGLLSEVSSSSFLSSIYKYVGVDLDERILLELKKRGQNITKQEMAQVYSIINSFRNKRLYDRSLVFNTIEDAYKKIKEIPLDDKMYFCVRDRQTDKRGGVEKVYCREEQDFLRTSIEINRRNISRICETATKMNLVLGYAKPISSIEKNLNILKAEKKSIIERITEVWKKTKVDARLNQIELQLYESLLDVYRKAVKREYWINDQILITSGISIDSKLKFIYVVNEIGHIIVDEERSFGIDQSRSSHSELAGGRPVYAAGEISFERCEGEWKVSEINNGSGHYKPLVEDRLNVVKKLLEEKNIPMHRELRLVDSLMRGRKVD